MYTLIVFLSMNMLVAQNRAVGANNNTLLNTFVKDLMDKNQYKFSVTSPEFTKNFSKKFTERNAGFHHVGRFLDWLEFCSDNDADENEMLYKIIKAIQEGRMKIDGTIGEIYRKNFNSCTTPGRFYEKGFPGNLIPSQQKTPPQQQAGSAPQRAPAPPAGGSSVSDECNQTYNMQTIPSNKKVNFSSNCLKKVGSNVTTLTINPGQNHFVHLDTSVTIHPGNEQGNCEDAYVTFSGQNFFGRKTGRANFCDTQRRGSYNRSNQGTCGAPLTSTSTNNKQYNNIMPTLNYTIKLIPCNNGINRLDDAAIELFANSTSFNLTLSLIILL